MPRKPVAPTERKRAVRGSVESRYLLRLPAELAGLVGAAAKSDGVTVAEWWRAAAVAALMLRAEDAKRWAVIRDRQSPIASSRPSSRSS